MKKIYIKRSIAIILSLVCLVLAFTSCKKNENVNGDDNKNDGSGNTVPVDTIAISSPHYSMNISEAAYLYYSTLSDFFSQNYDMISYFGLDMSKSHKDQNCMIVEGKTWFDFFLERTVGYANQCLVLSEAANAAGMELDEDDEARISQSFSQLEAYAASNNYSVKEYLELVYRNGVNEQNIYNSMRLSVLAHKFYTQTINSFEFTEDEYAAYISENFADEEDYDMINVRHILVSDENKAKDLLANIIQNDDVEAAFIAAVASNTTDGGSKDNGGLYPNVYKGQMITEFNDWCFDAARKVGDTGIVKTDYGYHIMYFVGFGDSYQRTKADEGLRAKAFDDKYSEFKLLYPVVTNEEALNSIDA